MTKTYYKVVTKSLTSVWAPEEVEVQYKIGKWVEPKIKEFPLAVFNSLDNARSFSCLDPSSKIFECEIQQKTRKTWLPGRSAYYCSEAIKEILQCIKNKKKFLDLVITDELLPCGTITCKRVKLIKEITNVN
jgi:hypothetical protein